jgi:hypothetical protein
VPKCLAFVCLISSLLDSSSAVFSNWVSQEWFLLNLCWKFLRIFLRSRFYVQNFQILIMSVPEKIHILCCHLWQPSHWSASCGGRTILLHCIQLSSDIVKLKEVFLPHPFYHDAIKT